MVSETMKIKKTEDKWTDCITPWARLWARDERKQSLSSLDGGTRTKISLKKLKESISKSRWRGGPALSQGLLEE